MRWDDAANARLFAAIMSVYQILPQGKQVEQIAKLVGPDCTAEAVKHQLRKYRAGKTKPGTGTFARKPAAKKPVVKPAVPNKGRKRTAALQKDDDTDADEEDEEAMPETPMNKGKARRSVSRSATKRVYTYDDDDGEEESEDGEAVAKKVKIEEGAEVEEEADVKDGADVEDGAAVQEEEDDAEGGAFADAIFYGDHDEV